MINTILLVSNTYPSMYWDRIVLSKAGIIVKEDVKVVKLNRILSPVNLQCIFTQEKKIPLFC